MHIILIFTFKGIFFILSETYLNILEKSYKVIPKLMHVETILFASINKYIYGTKERLQRWEK